MSLHLGNLSPRIRKDELERVFRQFGRCSVHLKDGYGFAKYDFEGDAEAALRALKGRKICGQTLDLSWSNQPPKSHQRFARGDKPHDRMRFNRNAGNRENYIQNKELIRNGDRIQHNQNGNGNGKGKVIDKQMGVDRYQPCYGDERFVEYDGDRDLGQYPDSDKYRRIHHPDNTRGSQTCFKCGASGHKMRDCPLKGALHKRKSNHSDHRHEKEPDIRSRNEVEGPETRSRLKTTCSQVESESNRTKEKYNSGKKRREREDLGEGPNDRNVRRSRSQERLSRSPLSHSLSVNSRSKSNSHNSRSRSHSRSSSLSVSLGRSAQSPLNEEQVNTSSPLNGSPTPHSKEILTEINKLFEPDDGENYPMENGTETLSDNQQPELDLVDYDPISPDCPDTNFTEPFDDDEIPNPEVVVEKNGDGDATAVGPLEDETEGLNEAERVLSMKPVNVSDSNGPCSSGVGTRLRISRDEVNRVLKHYGLKHRDNNDEMDNVEEYFGCARMWPWEMIYYRRHKKGLVSAENHARRVAQNTAFGIVDKFIRSSSGWFEPIEALP